MTTPNAVAPSATRLPSIGSIKSTVNLSPCYVIHTRAYRETSLLVELFSLDYGFVSTVARGARRKTSPLRALLQPFRALLGSWSGRGDLKVLHTVEASGRPQVLRQEVLASSFYLNELLSRLLQHSEAYPALFAYYADTLSALADTPYTMVPRLRVFEKKILTAIGYGLTLHRVAHSGKAVQPEQYYGFDPEVGILEEPRPTASVWGATLLALEYETPWELLAHRNARNFMRVLIAYRVGCRPIVSRALLCTSRPKL